MSKRTRALEPGSRPVECCYCPPGSPKVPFNLLKRHTKSTHGPPALYPPRTKDAVPIQDFFAKKAKKPKIEKTPKPAKAEPQSAPESNSKPQNSPWLTSLLNIPNTFISLLKLHYKAAAPLLKFRYIAASPLLRFRYKAAAPLLKFRYKAASPLLHFRYRAASPLQCQIAAFDPVFAPCPREFEVLILISFWGKLLSQTTVVQREECPNRFFPMWTGFSFISSNWRVVWSRFFYRRKEQG